MGLTPVFANGLFPVGTHVYREPYQDQAELMADLPILKRLGFNMIKIQESWAIDEPQEGNYDFSRIERIMTRARELELGVYLGLTMEQAPAWMWKKFPDAYLVYASGLPHNDPTQYCLPADGKPGPCWDHPGARQAGEHFVAELARRLGRFDNLWVWNTWQEIGFWPNEGGPLGFCYCPHTLDRFRQWLRAKYDTLSALNLRWYTAYSSWDEIEPPRRFSASPAFLDWRYFMDNAYITNALEWKTRALKEHDPGKRPVFSHVGGPRIGAGAEWRWSRVGDFFGNSNYPAWGPFDRWDDAVAEKASWHTTVLYEMWNSLSLRADMVRCATGRDRAYWGAEFQSGPISTYLHLGRTPDASDIRRWMLTGLAAGMNAISFWNHRAERMWQESNGFGLLDPQGETSERIEEAGRVARAINNDPAIFALGQPPKAQVALLINDDLYHFFQGTPDDALALLSHNVRGHYARLWRLGIPVDFVEAEEVERGGLAGYKVAILTNPLALDAGYFAHLRTFVEQGGTLISEACPGRLDRDGFCVRTQMVDGGEALFGARHKRVQIVQEPGGASKWTPGMRGYGEFAPPTVLEGAAELAGSSLRASFYLQTLTPTSGSALLHAGTEVAGVINSVGAGKAVLLGTFAGLCATAHHHPAADELMQRLLTLAGVQADRCGQLLRRRRVLDDQEAWFLTNPGASAVTETVALDGFSTVRELLGDARITRQEGEISVEVPAAGVVCLLLKQ